MEEAIGTGVEGINSLGAKGLILLLMGVLDDERGIVIVSSGIGVGGKDG